MSMRHGYTYYFIKYFMLFRLKLQGGQFVSISTLFLQIDPVRIISPASVHYFKSFSVTSFSVLSVEKLKSINSTIHYGSWLWSFQTGYTKLDRFLHKNQQTQRKLLNFENWTNGEPQ